MSALTFRIKKRPEGFLGRVGLGYSRLRHRWNYLAPGETLELSFTSGR